MTSAHYSAFPVNLEAFDPHDLCRDGGLGGRQNEPVKFQFDPSLSPKTTRVTVAYQPTSQLSPPGKARTSKLPQGSRIADERVANLGGASRKIRLADGTFNQVPCDERYLSAMHSWVYRQ